ncbi:MAG: Crp/Fnr family transcriptional regulator [Comamonadaceae bacterium]|jgi:CRP-like cAMP-binding protein|nr:Crp/Fnr family transcriptional regulator [Rhodoferax sp.]TSA12759.1 MAG: Crp/Fnr family transcriptional regulator [Comamonadaceae bacterium]
MDVEDFNIPRFLAVLPLFHDLSPAELERVAQGCQVRRLGRGDTIFRFGQHCEEFHVVISGQVKLFAISPTGQEKVIELVAPGHSFAEALMFTGKPYILNAESLASTLLLTVSKQSVFDEIERDPRFSMRMLAGISRRLHGLVRDIESGALHSGMQRVIGYLLSERQAGAGDAPQTFTVSLPVSKATLASRLSLTPEYFSKVLHELEAEKLIEIDKRDIRIVDVTRLACYGAH